MPMLIDVVSEEGVEPSIPLGEPDLEPGAFPSFATPTLWSPRQELNLHAVKQLILSQSCLPFHH